MRIVKIDKKNNEIIVIPETLDDLWHLERIVEVGDFVESRTFRSVKLGTSEERKPVFIRIQVEKIEFAKFANRLRLTGKIVQGSPAEFIQMGKYHTIEAEKDGKITLIKKWKQHHIKRLKEAEKEAKRPRIRIIVMDDEKALTALVMGYGIEFGPEIHCEARKRDEKFEEKKLKYYSEIMTEMERHEEKCIVAGPGFEKDNFKKYLGKKNPELLKKIVFETVSYAERTGVNELLKRGLVGRLIGEARIETEAAIIERLMVHINKDDGLAEYGFERVKNAIEMGAAEIVLVLDEGLRNDKSIEELVEVAEKSSVVVIFSSEAEPGQQLKGLGNVAAILRFRVAGNE
ncbi:mRNA surveillance protein pelota [Candidatus Micrarchaeota archaeon]|nr:mRNA surveillance protein pelota [Candidatus Micrarchaeota archaeon]